MPTYREQLVHQLQCQGPMTERAAVELANAVHAEALTTDGQDYPGQLAMLTGLVATLNVVAKHGDLAEVRHVLAEYTNDDAEAREQSSREAEATPDFFHPGRTYTEPDDSTDWQFRCDSITTDPGHGGRTALGWRHFRGEWEACAYGEDDWEIHQIADVIGTTGAVDE